MPEQPKVTHSWWTTIPGLLTGIAALITALTGLYVVLSHSASAPPNKIDPCKDVPFTERPLSCLKETK